MKWILYADDVVLFAKSIDEAKKLLDIIDGTCRRYGLTISYKKTKTQVFNDEVLGKEPSLICIDNQKIENVQEFTYLGHVIANTDSSCFTEHRIARATAKFNQLRNVLCDTKVNLRTRRKLLEACVQPRLIYGTQAWFPKEREMKKLEACWYECLRSMIRGGWKRVTNESQDDDEVEYRLVYSNRELESIIRTTPIRKIIQGQYIRYLGHVCRKENTELTKIMLFAESKRKYYRDPWKKISQIMGLSTIQIQRSTEK